MTFKDFLISHSHMNLVGHSISPLLTTLFVESNYFFSQSIENNFLDFLKNYWGLDPPPPPNPQNIYEELD